MHAPITISSEAGAAGEAGEVEKDSRHEEDVTASGGIFFPLVVESLGLWTPAIPFKSFGPSHRRQSSMAFPMVLL